MSGQFECVFDYCQKTIRLNYLFIYSFNLIWGFTALDAQLWGVFIQFSGFVWINSFFHFSLILSYISYLNFSQWSWFSLIPLKHTHLLSFPHSLICFPSCILWFCLHCSGLSRAVQWERAVQQGCVHVLQRLEGAGVWRAPEPVRRPQLWRSRDLRPGQLHLWSGLPWRVLRGR